MNTNIRYKHVHDDARLYPTSPSLCSAASGSCLGLLSALNTTGLLIIYCVAYGESVSRGRQSSDSSHRVMAEKKRKGSGKEKSQCGA
ncbi:hypothetical protein HaLaN_19778 [Haematococcus lacustris]|uniref:Uncharacterized protein n=1 Tax=Haematococcus lacustris TaxID=44745 RepID=A0A699ZHY1_HAELA|nr:hypothetical protein HaLaN_19778 [Haematococcus lacustris]